MISLMIWPNFQPSAPPHRPSSRPAKASLPPAPFENTDHALLTDFRLDWPLPSSGEAESAAPTAPAEKCPRPPSTWRGWI